MNAGDMSEIPLVRRLIVPGVQTSPALGPGGAFPPPGDRPPKTKAGKRIQRHKKTPAIQQAGEREEVYIK
jgi:hypothetical protein